MSMDMLVVVWYCSKISDPEYLESIVSDVATLFGADVVYGYVPVKPPRGLVVVFAGKCRRDPPRELLELWSRVGERAALLVNTYYRQVYVVKCEIRGDACMTLKHVADAYSDDELSSNKIYPLLDALRLYDKL